MRAVCGFVVLVFLTSPACARREGGPSARVQVSILPPTLYTVTEGVYAEPSANPAGGHADQQNLTWLFHIVFKSEEPVALALEQVEATFRQDERALWRETFERDYLERLEWLKGAFEMTSEYYLTRTLHGREEPGGPDLPAGEAVSWLLRAPFARPWFARPDRLDLRFRFRDADGQIRTLDHTVATNFYQQTVKLRLPFSGIWAANAGNDLSTGHRRTGLNGLTNYAWDFVKLGSDGMPYRTDAKTPEDYYTYDQPALAAAAGTVVHVRNDIPEFGVGEAPPPDLLRRDGDAFAGNLVVLDHGNGEYSLTSHMRAGTVTVRPGDNVEAGQVLGRVGNSGYSGVPHIHFNLMDSGQWLEARGVPSLFSDFERIRTGGPPQRIELGNPITGWLVRPGQQAG